MKTVAIVGTGLIGASFGLALRKAGYGGAIVGVSSAPAIRDALAAGAIDRGAPLEEAVAEADLIFLSQTIGPHSRYASPFGSAGETGRAS